MSSNQNNRRRNNKSNLCNDTCESLNGMFFGTSNSSNNNKSSSAHSYGGAGAGAGARGNITAALARNLVQDDGSRSRIVDYDRYGQCGGTLLFKAIVERQWKSVLSRLTMCPHEVSTFVYRVDHTESSGEEDNLKFQYVLLPLHAALQHKPPGVVISSLIAAYPHAVRQKCDGDLPLHIALKHGSSLQCIEHLVLSYPKSIKVADVDRNSPLKVYEMNIMSWTEDSEKKSIKKVLTKGINSIVVNEGENEDTAANGDGTSFLSSAEEKKLALSSILHEEGWLKESGLTVIVIGASGDLAKKKTYPSLLRLFSDNLLPKHTNIWGYARSAIQHDDLRNRIRPYLEKSGSYSSETIDAFLDRCFYQRGSSYGDKDAYGELAVQISEYENTFEDVFNFNRLFYFAIPPNVFEDTGVAIKENAMADKGWTRVIIEKPFGRDLKSCEELLGTLSKHFYEEQMFRIDHYLGKEMVQNLIMMRFGNLWFERIWNRDNIQCVILTFKEPFGTDGRGGYFDKYGIIRDIIQNHLLQVLSLLAMEAPSKVDGSESGESIRDAKVQVLTAIPPITIEDCFLGQYEGYLDDPTIENKKSNTPTFAAIRCFVNTPRWEGIPFIFKAGKALNERKGEMRIQFKDVPAASFLFESKCPRNELVMRLQPNEAIYLKTNVKTPGFSSSLIQKELEVEYETRFSAEEADDSPDAYTRLILDVLRGKSATFVREDELRRAWEIFTPLLQKIEEENIRPVIYKQGTRGPPEADVFINSKSGYVRNEDYVFSNDGKMRKSAL